MSSTSKSGFIFGFVRADWLTLILLVIPCLHFLVWIILVILKLINSSALGAKKIGWLPLILAIFWFPVVIYIIIKFLVHPKG